MMPQHAGGEICIGPIRNSNEVKSKQFIESPNWEYSCTLDHLLRVSEQSTGFVMGSYWV